MFWNKETNSLVKLDTSMFPRLKHELCMFNAIGTNPSKCALAFPIKEPNAETSFSQTYWLYPREAIEFMSTWTQQERLIAIQSVSPLDFGGRRVIDLLKLSFPEEYAMAKL